MEISGLNYKPKETSNSYDIISEEFPNKPVQFVKCGLEGGYVLSRAAWGMCFQRCFLPREEMLSTKRRCFLPRLFVSD